MFQEEGKVEELDKNKCLRGMELFSPSSSSLLCVHLLWQKSEFWTVLKATTILNLIWSDLDKAIGKKNYEICQVAEICSITS